MLRCDSGSQEGTELPEKEWKQLKPFKELAKEVRTGSSEAQFVIDRLNITNNAEGVVQNTDGSIAYNLMQNDMVALRAVMRLGWEIPNPINALAKDKTKRCPFSILKAGE